jgi:hypothetical protein
MTSGASAAGESVVAVFIHLTTANASMRANKGQAKTQADTDAQFFIAQMQSQTGARKRIEPGAGTGSN